MYDPNAASAGANVGLDDCTSPKAAAVAAALIAAILAAAVGFLEEPGFDGCCCGCGWAAAVSVTSASLSKARSLSSSLMMISVHSSLVLLRVDDFFTLLPSCVPSLRRFSAGSRVSAEEYLTGFFCTAAASQREREVVRGKWRRIRGSACIL